MTPEEREALLRQLGMRPAWQGTREARPGYQQQQSPAGALADPRTVPYRRVPTRRDREFSRAALADTMQRGAYSEPRNQFAEAGMNALETTGAPEIARGVRSIQANEPGQAAGHFALGGLGLLGTASLPFGGGARAAPQRVPRIAPEPNAFHYTTSREPISRFNEGTFFSTQPDYYEAMMGIPQEPAGAIYGARLPLRNPLILSDGADNEIAFSLRSNTLLDRARRNGHDAIILRGERGDEIINLGEVDAVPPRVPRIQPEAPYRLPNAPPRLPTRATDGTILPLRPPEPMRQSLVGGSDDLADAARMRPDGGSARAGSSTRVYRGTVEPEGMPDGAGLRDTSPQYRVFDASRVQRAERRLEGYDAQYTFAHEVADAVERAGGQFGDGLQLVLKTRTAGIDRRTPVFNIMRNGERIGIVDLGADETGLRLHPSIQAAHRRQNIGTQLYQYLERLSGRPLSRSDNLTEAGAGLWGRLDRNRAQPDGGSARAGSDAANFFPRWEGDRLTIWQGDLERGGLNARIVDGELRLEAMGLPPEMRGRGTGQDIIEMAMREAESRGLPVVTDVSVSDDALRMFRAMRKRGYEVIESPYLTRNGRWNQANGDPVLRIRRAQPNAGNAQLTQMIARRDAGRTPLEDLARQDPLNATFPWDRRATPTEDMVRAAFEQGATRGPASDAVVATWGPKEHAERIATLMREGWDDPISLREVEGRLAVNDGYHRLAAARLRGDRDIATEMNRPPPMFPGGRNR